MSNTHSILIERCRKGDEKAMMRIYDLYCQGMFQVACRYLNDEDAKDAIQDSFLKAFTKLEFYTEQFSFGSWLKRIVINQCIDALKKNKVEFIESSQVQLTTLTDLDDWMFESSITKAQIIEVIDQLPLKFQVVVKLYLIEGFDHEEIASILNIPVKTSRTHLFRGKKILREQLKPFYDEARY
ncbi:RNA polymerase sigma factor [Psychroserpens sp.]|uniref:RNA polymerase sigma factor n=1 Tax=Psychroserpens sp. TaxID=2020870 RepID=UPI001B2A9100|nr:sigma-70 family RNA polymerase sigma factor [Psychroserpens sp.]MBO6606866.1 sigma-70 family RNA polymerase sigma factor [Psychroserpens sp.]MBO6632224.1 sigma-70 family RNA polymerase sigma factor [Psychroserpens sp.]MBO6654012.1 sigma-70 family RNA polymerase sigma factor [Psychroserpens sp.]MBO6682702.1 sigma-70 family RNA polymerase sigma factor [Psychroserpens sp.]MBO6750638.1 sigma-70 family RNA polymerase sigma factor [Psychroserpens sp.]